MVDWFGGHRRRLLIVAAIMVIAAVAARYGWKRELQQKREAGYQATVRAYSKDLRLGLTRTEVERYLGARHIGFFQMCCILGRSAYADLVKIGQEDAPWYCRENDVFIALQFTATEVHAASEAYGSDVLTGVTIHHQLETCL